MDASIIRNIFITKIFKMDEAIPVRKEDWKNLKNKLSDITRQLADMNAISEAIKETVNDPVLILDQHLRIKSATKGFYDKFNTTGSETEEHFFYNLKRCPWNSPDLILKLEKIILQKSSFTDYEIDCSIPGLGERVFMINARYLESDNNFH